MSTWDASEYAAHRVDHAKKAEILRSHRLQLQARKEALSKQYDMNQTNLSTRDTLYKAYLRRASASFQKQLTGAQRRNEGILTELDQLKVRQERLLNSSYANRLLKERVRAKALHSP